MVTLLPIHNRGSTWSASNDMRFSASKPGRMLRAGADWMARLGGRTSFLCSSRKSNAAPMRVVVL